MTSSPTSSDKPVEMQRGGRSPVVDAKSWIWAGAVFSAAGAIMLGYALITALSTTEGSGVVTGVTRIPKSKGQIAIDYAVLGPDGRSHKLQSSEHGIDAESLRAGQSIKVRCTSANTPDCMTVSRFRSGRALGGFLFLFGLVPMWGGRRALRRLQGAGLT